VIAAVADEIAVELPRLFPERIDVDPRDATPSADVERPDFSNVREVDASTTGYVRVVAAEGLFDLAVERDLVIELIARPGDFVVEGETVARVHPRDRCGDEVGARVCRSFTIGAHRTAVQDLAFLTDQLAEMAVRALSPGINDPKTAIACVHRLGVVIATVSERRTPPPEQFDADGRLRIVARPITFADSVESCLDPIRRYGGTDASVVEAVFVALARAAARCSDASRRAELVGYAREWVDGFIEHATASKRDRERVEAGFARVAEASADPSRLPG
jgi:uncharacterized membrane protein